MLSISVTKFGLRNPRSNCMPSTTSTVVSRLLPSSTVITPSFPTLEKAFAIILPTSGSLFAEIVATASMLFSTDVDMLRIDSVTVSVALRIPRTNAFASVPAARCRSPLLKIASASTVAVVVPSPASSEVFEATSFTSCAPWFSILSRSSISSATVTPSLVTVGPPQDLSNTAFRPRGPRVDLTAEASFSTPCNIFFRASTSKAKSFAAMGLSPVWCFSPLLGQKNLFLFDHHRHVAPQHTTYGYKCCAKIEPNPTFRCPYFRNLFYWCSKHCHAGRFH